jgi:hypothetical protein
MLAFQEGFQVNNLFYLDTILNILFFIDILVNFNTAILLEDLEIIDNRRVTILFKLNFNLGDRHYIFKGLVHN